MPGVHRFGGRLDGPAMRQLPPKVPLQLLRARDAYIATARRARFCLLAV